MKSGIIGGIELYQVNEPARLQFQDQGRRRRQKFFSPVQNRHLDGSGLLARFHGVGGCLHLAWWRRQARDGLRGRRRRQHSFQGCQHGANLHEVALLHFLHQFPQPVGSLEEHGDGLRRRHQLPLPHQAHHVFQLVRELLDPFQAKEPGPPLYRMNTTKHLVYHFGGSLPLGGFSP